MICFVESNISCTGRKTQRKPLFTDMGTRKCLALFRKIRYGIQVMKQSSSSIIVSSTLKDYCADGAIRHLHRSGASGVGGGTDDISPSSDENSIRRAQISLVQQGILV